MPKEYIERKAFIKTLEKTKNDCKHYADKVVCDFAIKMAKLMPTADVQEVVRCKDCRWRSTEECAMYYRCNCGEQHTWESDNDFCSYGERERIVSMNELQESVRRIDKIFEEDIL